MVPTRSLPSVAASPVEGVRDGGDRVDLRAELVDVQALDSGRHRALIVVDPSDRRGIKGFLYLASISSELIAAAERQAWPLRRFSPPGVDRRLAEAEMLHGLADKMSSETQVKTTVLDAIRLDDSQLMRVPFLLFTASSNFEFTRSEARNLGFYLTSGGFVYFDVVTPTLPTDRQGRQDLRSMRRLVEVAFREAGYSPLADWRFERLDQQHPVYHSYYDLDSVPKGLRDIWFPYWPESERPEQTPEYLEGIYLGEEMVGLYSMKNYGDLWAGMAQRLREDDAKAGLVGMMSVKGRVSVAPEIAAYRLGVNILVYALTREGSLAQRLVAVK